MVSNKWLNEAKADIELYCLSKAQLPADRYNREIISLLKFKTQPTNDKYYLRNWRRHHGQWYCTNNSTKWVLHPIV